MASKRAKELAADVWLPKSQAEIVEDGGKTFVQLPRWLAVDKGLV